MRFSLNCLLLDAACTQRIAVIRGAIKKLGSTTYTCTPIFCVLVGHFNVIKAKKWFELDGGYEHIL